MKLVEILARELGEWPERSSGREWISITQDGDGELNYCPTPNPQFDTAINQWLADGGVACDGTRAELADDYKTAIITREMWQAERDRIAQKKKAVKSPKANKDGWIRHRGGKCPVDLNMIIDIRCRNGRVHLNEPSLNFIWTHSNDIGDAMAWRPHKPEQPSLSSVSADGELWSDAKEMPAAKYFDGPIQWRDRIREIDAEQESEEAAHKAATERRDAERASLVAKLAAEGFALIQVDEPNVVVESAQQDIAQQDMSDPANWREGDILECIDGPESYYTNGKLYEFIEISTWGSARAVDDRGTENGIMPEQFKWHSRPTT